MLPHNALYGGVANSIRTATPVNAGATAAIATEVSKQTTTLVDGIKRNSQTDIMQARRTLIEDADTITANNKEGQASAAYQAAYAGQLEPVLSKLIAAPNPRLVRLNAAIILGEVAEKVSRTDNADIFANVAALLLQSKEFEGQLWGLKIAKYAIASDADKNGKLGNPSLNLNKLIVKAVENSKYPGELIDEAYQTLRLDPITPVLQNNRKLEQSLALQTLPDILDLVEWRTQQYKSGPVPNPRAELELTGYLPLGGALDAVTSAPELRDRTLKAIGELTCAQLKAASDAIAAGNPADPDLIEVARNCGSAMASFGTALTGSNPPVTGAEALGAAGDMIRTIQLTTPDDKLKSWCDGLAKALQGMNIQVSMP